MTAFHLRYEDDEDPAGIIVATFDVALIKTLKAGQPSNVAVGDDVTFTISIVNQGTIPATNIQVTDYIPTVANSNTEHYLDTNWLYS